MLKLNEMQMKVLDYMDNGKKDITICATGAGSGQSYISDLLPVLLQTDVIVLSKFRKDIGAVYDKLSEVSIKCNPNFRENRIEVGGNSITFIQDIKSLRSCSINTLLVVDHIEHFSKDDRSTLRHFENRNKMLFLTQPIHCGWREPKYEYGLLQRYEGTSTLICEKVSWDHHLINWREDKLRAEVGDYRRGVNVITNYGVVGNPYLNKSAYTEVMGKLPLDAYLKLQGRWIS
jgi:hypothetical protein